MMTTRPMAQHELCERSTCPFTLSKAVKMGVWWYMRAHVSCGIEKVWAVSAGFTASCRAAKGLTCFPRCATELE